MQNVNQERHANLVRWVTAAVAALILADSVPWLTILAGLGFVAIYSGAVAALGKLPSLDARRQRWVRLGACLGDIAIISFASAVSHGAEPRLYSLYVLPIVWSGYVARRPQTVLAVTALSILGDGAALLYAHGPIAPDIALDILRTPTIVLLVAGAIAGTLFVYKQRDEAMLRRDRKLSSLLQFGTQLGTEEDVARLMEQTLRAAIADTDASSGYIMLISEDGGGELVTEVAISTGEEQPFPKQRARGEGIEGYVAQTGMPLVLASDESSAVRDDPQLRFDGNAVLCVPMIEAGPNVTARVIGVFSLLKQRNGSRFLDEDVDLARTIVGLTTMAVVNSRLYESRKASFLRALQTLANTLEARDAYTRGHSYRVSELCVMMARQLHVAPQMIDDLRNGALLHDIGKIGIPDAVLRKPGRLTDEEFDIMKQHPVIGFDICQPLGLHDGILMLIRNHHEKLDGTGYPDNLKLGELPLPLRIICVADAFDAMSSSRPYRQTMDSRIRNEQLNRFAGTQFDPIVVEALKSMLQNGELDELYKDHWTLPNAPHLELIVDKAA